MLPSKPLDTLPTHSVTNMPPYMGDQDLWRSDPALQEAVNREGAAWAQTDLVALGRRVGTNDIFELAEQANRYSPEIKAYDRYGMRVNQVIYHPAYHDLMRLAIENQVPSFAWNHTGPGAQVGHMALSYMFNQVEGGVMCPMAMTYSAIPPLQTTPALADEWIPRLLSSQYDARDIPVTEKTGATMGMFMTEKQGGSDVRSNSTAATPVGSKTGIGTEYRLTGHKYFCSAPMCDAFLTLAYTEAGLSCFLVPRWTPDGVRNGLFIQRIKDKMGNRSNASTEMELQDTWGIMVGEEGRGVRTIIDMVQGNRIYCCVSSAALMRQGLVQALHHTSHRSAFGSLLIDQPMMRNVLADLALESEAAMVLAMRIARSMDEAADHPDAAALARIGTAIGKFWNCKRAPMQLFEAMECHGGPGYVEESILPRLYREAPVNSIWEGSGNVMCLDVLRAMQREPAAVPALMAELERARGGHPNLDRTIADLKAGLDDLAGLELRARQLTEQMAMAWQGALLVEHAPAAVAEAFCVSRLGAHYSGVFGTLPKDSDLNAIIDRAVRA
ncbi:MAG: acyl-CoA dehydrogenase family protein [Arenicellales bacterium]|nr:acyl-CoA dehydrogenase family protein [Arenicellales bacterium]MDP7482557.1 acyl-CoA dehydrogenase family protein [Arenicellales bacterium]HJL66823.1 acyl-CoA dehydrogenase family protein [Arenicellales bacterium]